VWGLLHTQHLLYKNTVVPLKASVVIKVFFTRHIYTHRETLLPPSSQSHITTDNQSASPSWCQVPIWDLRPIFLSPVFLLDSCGLVFCIVFCISVICCCCWSPPAQSRYCLPSLMRDQVCSHWGFGGYQSQSQSYFTTDGQSVSMSWCRAQSGTFDQRYFFLF
jgi:hypothetical protein